MRKITQTLALDPGTFEPTLAITIKNPDGTIEKLSADREIFNSKYTFAQQAKINVVDQVLADKGYPELTDDEIEYLLRIGKFKLGSDLPDEPEDLQALAGFKVKKEIIYTDKPE